MAMTAGSVSVAADGAVTKSGFAAIAYDALYAQYLVNVASNGSILPSGDILTAVKKGFAEEANARSLVITYIQANGTAGGDPVL